MPFRHGLIEPVIAAPPAVGGVALIVALIALTLQDARQGPREAAARSAPGATRADTPSAGVRATRADTPGGES